MKANELTSKELMDGDWVQMNNGPAIVIKEKDILFKDRFGKGIAPTCNPIPLTPEILEKNGFEKQWQDNYEYFDDDESLNITFHPKSSNYTNGAYDYIDIEKGCITINEMPIEFVHEPQHALRLCGIEKEIIL